MVARGYTTALLVAKQLGRDLTAAQLDECADLVAEAESWIDQETGRAWMVSSPTTDELHTITGPLVYLKNRPVVAVTSVKVRSLYVGAQDTTLVANTSYELADATNGVLLLSSVPYGTDVTITTTGIPLGWLVKVSYTSTTPVPGDIQRAATLLVAHWMLPRLDPDRQGLDSYSVGQELQVKLRADGVPAEVQRIVRGHEAIVIA